MADEQVVVHGINWKETFPFTHIFRSFRIAIHPSKLVLALLALLAIYLGGRALDTVWPDKHNGVPEEVNLYEQAWLISSDPGTEFERERNDKRAEILAEYKAYLQSIDKPNGSLKDVEWRLKNDRDKIAQAARDSYNNADRSSSEKEEQAQRIRDETIRAAYAEAYFDWGRYKQVEGTGLFQLFYDYELSKVNLIVRAVQDWNWIGTNGVIDGVRGFFILGPAWAIKHHPVYFLLFGLFFLTVWAIFGGAISRIAAVHVARDEKISIRQALAFSSSKFLSFVSAPVIPVLIILVVGLIIAVGGLVGNIPWIGPVLVGLLFFLALAAGFVMTLVLLGLAGGFNLMYPTIAVEGSDSFDAISRSFSYLYARPWRLAFYTAVAIVYGAFTYTFVRFFIILMLYLTHAFVGMFFVSNADNAQNLWPTLWPNPVRKLTYNIDYFTLGPAQDLGAGLLSIWVYLAIGMLGAFAISFYFSSNTIIYFLMRREVDATEMDDVYLEQSEEEFAEGATPSPAPVAGGDVPSAPASASEPLSPPRAAQPPDDEAPPV